MAGRPRRRDHAVRPVGRRARTRTRPATASGRSSSALHWPSKAWSDRELKERAHGLLGDEPAGDADAVTVEEAVDEYAAQLGDDPEMREALTTVLAHAASTRTQDAADADELPSEVADAYRRSLAARGRGRRETSRCSAAGWDPGRGFAEAAHGEADDGLLGDGWFSKLREAVLTPLRQLTFWSGKNHAREFGEGGAAEPRPRGSWRRPDARVHLMGHSFGTIVVSSAVRGPGSRPTPPPRPVSSLFLVQGAVSLWAFAEEVPD